MGTSKSTKLSFGPDGEGVALAQGMVRLFHKNSSPKRGQVDTSERCGAYERFARK